MVPWKMHGARGPDQRPGEASAAGVLSRDAGR